MSLIELLKAQERRRFAKEEQFPHPSLVREDVRKTQVRGDDDNGDDKDDGVMTISMAMMMIMMIMRTLVMTMARLNMMMTKILMVSMTILMNFHENNDDPFNDDYNIANDVALLSQPAVWEGGGRSLLRAAPSPEVWITL